MSKWKCDICNTEFENFEARGFNNTIYCPLCYYKKLYKQQKEVLDKIKEYLEITKLIYDEDTCEILSETWYGKELMKLLEELDD